MTQAAQPSQDRNMFWAALIAWAVVSPLLYLSGRGELAGGLGTIDDAMRLVQVRGLLDGPGWFATLEPRYDPPQGYVTHWSRLVDAPIAGLVLIGRAVTSPSGAETFARAVWPLALLLPALLGCGLIGARLGGRSAGVMAAVFGALCLPGLTVFRPGALDHHNIQIVLAVAGLGATLHLDRRPGWAVPAALIWAALLSIGLEAVQAFLAAAVLLLWRIGRDPTFRPTAARFMAAFGASVAGFTLLTTPASLRLTPVCDALGLNYAVGITLGAGLAALVLWRGISGWSLMAGLTVAALVAVAAALALEPRCAAGPFALFDPRIGPLWLHPMWETQNLGFMLRYELITALVVMVAPLLGLGAGLLLAARGAITVETAAIAGAMAAFAIGGSVGEVRWMLYASWLAAPLMGAALAHVCAGLRCPALTQGAAVAALNPATAIVALLAVLPGAFGTSGTAADAPHTGRHFAACTAPAGFQALARLPAGLVMSVLDLGPHTLALTPHSVVAGQFHRLDRAIVFTQLTFAGPPETAQARLAQRGVDYVVDCPGISSPAVDRAPGTTLRAALLRGPVPDGFTPLDLGPGVALRVWQVRR